MISKGCFNHNIAISRTTRNMNKDKHKTYPNLIKMLSLISALGIIE